MMIKAPVIIENRMMMLNIIGGVELTQTPEWYVEMLRGNHSELCVHSLQVPTLNNKTFLNPYYTFIPKTLKQDNPAPKHTNLPCRRVKSSPE